MKLDELVKGLNFLGLAYGKEYSQLEVQQIYEFVKEYDYETFIRATKEIIRTSKFIPKIADLIEACEENKNKGKIEVIDYMRNIGYFKYSPYGDISDDKALKNYYKAVNFIETNNIPDWFQEDIVYYYDQMQRVKLENKNNKLLS